MASTTFIIGPLTSIVEDVLNNLENMQLDSRYWQRYSKQVMDSVWHETLSSANFNKHADQLQHEMRELANLRCLLVSCIHCLPCDNEEWSLRDLIFFDLDAKVRDYIWARVKGRK